MNDAYVSAATGAVLEKEFAIHWSPIRLIVYGLVALVMALAFLFLAYRTFVVDGVGAVMVVLLLIGLGLCYACYRFVLPKLKRLGQPVITLSGEGITFFESPMRTWSPVVLGTPLPWGRIVEVHWNQIGYAGFRAGVYVAVKTADERPIMFSGMFLKIRGSEFLRRCDLYRGAAAAPASVMP